MPRRRKPARLWQRPDTGDWIILDGGRQRSTGHRGERGRGAAEAALSRYLATRIGDSAGPAAPSAVTVGEVLALYARDRGPDIRSPATLAYSIKALAPFWAALPCDAVRGSTCRAYAAQSRRTAATARRELGVLQAALNHAHAEGRLIHAPRVTLPPAPQPRDRWLTRDEVAKVMRAAAPHLRRFILISLATGTRASAVLGLRWGPSLDSGWVDVERGVIHRRGSIEVETRKRRGSVRATVPLHAHLRRWAREGGTHVIMWRGKPLAEIDTAWRAAVARAGIAHATIHDLKRTAVTWAFQRGMSREDASDWFDTTAATLERVYRVHSPDHQSRARAIMGAKR